MILYWFDGMLYFSLEGYLLLGGFDIFYVVWNGMEWSEFSNMGKVYNMEVDELLFCFYDEGYKGYFIFNCLEGCSVCGKICCDDIYGFFIVCQFVDLVVGIFSEDC